MLKKEYKQIGVGFGPHAGLNTVCVILLAAKFDEKESDDVINAPEGAPEQNEYMENWKEGAIKLVTEMHTHISPNGEPKEMIYKWTM